MRIPQNPVSHQVNANVPLHVALSHTTMNHSHCAELSHVSHTTSWEPSPHHTMLRRVTAHHIAICDSPCCSVTRHAAPHPATSFLPSPLSPPHISR